MKRIVWITGRAATGKSTVIAELSARLSAPGQLKLHTFCDEDLLFRLKAADHDHVHHWHPEGDPARFGFRSGHLFDEGLRIINESLTSLMTDENNIAIVELARGRPGPGIDVSYRRALELVDRRCWERSVVFRLTLPFPLQLQRNERRTRLDGRGTPENIMMSLYDEDDPGSLRDAGVPVINVTALPAPGAVANEVLRHLEDTDFMITTRC